MNYSFCLQWLFFESPVTQYKNQAVQPTKQSTHLNPPSKNKKRVTVDDWILV